MGPKSMGHWEITKVELYFFPLPSSFDPSILFLPGVKSVTSVTESVAELPSSLQIEVIHASS
jgi:hypothetical protein